MLRQATVLCLVALLAAVAIATNAGSTGSVSPGQYGFLAAPSSRFYDLSARELHQPHVIPLDNGFSFRFSITSLANCPDPNGDPALHTAVACVCSDTGCTACATSWVVQEAGKLLLDSDGKKVKLFADTLFVVVVAVAVAVAVVVAVAVAAVVVGTVVVRNIMA
jgi:hypothetical protein